MLVMWLWPANLCVGGQTLAKLPILPTQHCNRLPLPTIMLSIPASRFLFKDQYIEISTNVPEDADLYGLGEVTIPTGLKLPRDNRIITLFNADTSSLVPYRNLYGSHPFLLQVNKGVLGQFCLSKTPLGCCLCQWCSCCRAAFYC